MWNAEGTTLVVSSPDSFSAEVLPKYFKSSNFSSFVRQLHFYGFRKTDKDKNSWEFQHPSFQRGKAANLSHISRKTCSDYVGNTPNNTTEIETLKATVETLREQLDETRKCLQQTNILVLQIAKEGNKFFQKKVQDYASELVRYPYADRSLFSFSNSPGNEMTSQVSFGMDYSTSFGFMTQNSLQIMQDADAAPTTEPVVPEGKQNSFSDRDPQINGLSGLIDRCTHTVGASSVGSSSVEGMMYSPHQVKEIVKQVLQSQMGTDDGNNLYIGEEAKNPIRFNPKDSSKQQNASDGANYSLSNLYANSQSISQDLLDVAMTEKSNS